MREIIKTKNYLKNIDVVMVKDLNDELDVFYKEVEFAEVGHKYSIFSPQKSANVKKTRKYDEKIVDEMENVTEACKQLLDAITKERDIDLKKEIEDIKNYLVRVRNEFNSRFGVLKGVE